jgi:hypothetical protein
MESTAVEMLPLDIPALKATEGFWYLGTPYTKYPAGNQTAFEHACVAAAHLVEAGVRVFCPIAHTHSIAVQGGLDPLDDKIWIPASMPMMTVARGLIVCKMPTWEESQGLSLEIAQFSFLGAPVYEMPWPLR